MYYHVPTCTGMYWQLQTCTNMHLHVLTCTNILCIKLYKFWQPTYRLSNESSIEELDKFSKPSIVTLIGKCLSNPPNWKMPSNLFSRRKILRTYFCNHRWTFHLCNHCSATFLLMLTRSTIVKGNQTSDLHPLWTLRRLSKCLPILLQNHGKKQPMGSL